MPVVGHVEYSFDIAGAMAQVEEAVRIGIDETMEATVHRAKEFHEYDDHTGLLQDSVMVLERAHNQGPYLIAGQWGSLVDYSLYVEIGTSRPWSGAPRAEQRAEAAGGDMGEIAPPEPGGPHTNTRWLGSSIPPDMLASGLLEATAFGGYKIPGQGPLMEPRLSMRSAATIEYALIPVRIAEAYRMLAP